MNRPFVQSLDQETYDKLIDIAKERNMTLQRLLEGVIIFEWLKKREEKK